MGLVTRYIIDIQETLRMLLKQPVDKEMLHKFRVQIKKMKAIWAIHPIGNTIDFKQSFRKISKLYKLAAPVRDKQMVLSCLQSLPAFPEYPELEKKLNSGIKNHRKKFIKAIKIRSIRYGLYEETRFYTASFKASSATLIRQNRKEFEHQTFNMLSLETGKDPKKLHKLRMQCKYLLFQCNAFHSGLAHHGKAHIKEAIDHLQQNLGTWHDWWNTVEWLNQLKSGEMNMLPLKTLLNQAIKKEEILRRDVLKNIQSLLNGFKLQIAS